MTRVNQIAMAAATTSNPAKSPCRFCTDQAGYAAMRTYAKAWPDRLWAHAVVTVRYAFHRSPGTSRGCWLSTGRAEAAVPTNTANGGSP